MNSSRQLSQWYNLSQPIQLLETNRILQLLKKNA